MTNLRFSTALKWITSSSEELDRIFQEMDQMFPSSEGYKPYEWRQGNAVPLWMCAGCRKDYDDKYGVDIQNSIVNNAAYAAGVNITHGMCKRHFVEYGYGEESDYKE